MFHMLGDGKILDELVVDPFVKRGKAVSGGVQVVLDPMSGTVEGIWMYLTISEISHFNFTPQYDILF